MGLRGVVGKVVGGRKLRRRLGAWVEVEVGMDG